MTTLENKINRASSSFANTTEDKFETEAILKDDAFSAGGSTALTAKQILQALLGILKRRKYFVIAFVAIIVVGFGIYGKYFNLTDAERAQKELAAAVAAVEELMVLPEGDEPVLATVTDAEALTKQQAFFTGAVNGDQLLLFPKNLKAVIYSPLRNKIINAGPIEQQPQPQTNTAAVNDQFPISLDGQAIEDPRQSRDNFQSISNDQNSNVPSSAEATAGRQNILTVEVRNGTRKNGLAAEAAEILRKAGFTIVTVGDAKDKNYAKTILAMNTESAEKKKLATSLVAQLEAELMDKIPKGEKNTDADVLVILGGE